MQRTVEVRDAQFWRRELRRLSRLAWSASLERDSNPLWRRRVRWSLDLVRALVDPRRKRRAAREAAEKLVASMEVGLVRPQGDVSSPGLAEK